MSDALQQLLDFAATHLERGQLGAARAAVRTVIAAAPKEVRAWRLLGAIEQRADDFDRAAAAYRRCLVLGDDDLHVRVNLAEIAIKRFALEPALELLRDVIARDPEVAHPAGLRARVLALRLKAKLG